jgi:hypothetical protein
MEELYSSEKLVPTNQNTRCINPENYSWSYESSKQLHPQALFFIYLPMLYGGSITVLAASHVDAAASNGRTLGPNNMILLAASHVDAATSNGHTLGPTIYSYHRHSVYNVVDNY